MGTKVGIDCSTLMNKGFEVIETKWLFDLPLSKIDVIIHPQSIIHSLVGFIDGYTKAILANPSMQLPIQYALTHVERRSSLEELDLCKQGKLEFYAPDKSRFRCLELAYEALKLGGTLPCALNAANEVLVERFCRGEVKWLSIPEKLEILLERHEVLHGNDLETIEEADKNARMEAKHI